MYTEITGKKISMEDAGSYIDDYAEANRRGKSENQDDVIREVCAFYGMTFDEITAHNGYNENAEPRQVLATMLRCATDMRLDAIGKKLKRRDHTFTIYSIGKIADKLEMDESFRNKMQPLLQKFDLKVTDVFKLVK